MSDRYAIVRSGRVENVVEWDGASDWAPSDGAELVKLDLRRTSHRSADIGQAYDGTDFGRDSSIAATREQVITERTRRLALGFDYDFGDARGVHRIGTTKADLEGWDEVTKGAQAAIALGQPDVQIGIVTNTGPTLVKAIEWMQILAAATAHRQPIWQASFILQAQSPIPADYADDSHWPADLLESAPSP